MPIYDLLRPAPLVLCWAAALGCTGIDPRAATPDESHETETSGADADSSTTQSGPGGVSTTTVEPATTSPTTGDDPFDSTTTAPPLDMAWDPDDGLPRVRIVYLVPSDRTPKANYVEALERTFSHLQSYFYEHVGETFRMGPVEIVQTNHPSAYYTSDPQTGMFWTVGNEAYELIGAQHSDPQNVWMIYIDAEHACDSAMGAVPSMVIQPASMLRGLSLEPNFGPCPGEETVDNGSRCQWFGGAAHEFAHAAGPLGHTDCEVETCTGYELLTAGYRHYPNATLSDEEKTVLADSPFFVPMSAPPPAGSCG